MKICTTCGAQNENHHDMCGVCGTPLFAQASISEEPEADDTPSQTGFFGAPDPDPGEAPLLEVEPIPVEEAQAPAEELGEAPLLEVEPIPVEEAQAPIEQFTEATLIEQVPAGILPVSAAAQPDESAAAQPDEGASPLAADEAHEPPDAAPSPAGADDTTPSPSEAARLADEIIAQAKSARATSVSLDDAPDPVQSGSRDALEAPASLEGSEDLLSAPLPASEDDALIPDLSLTGEIEPDALTKGDATSTGDAPENDVSLEALAEDATNAHQAAGPLATSAQEPLSGDLDISALVDSTIEEDSGLIDVTAEQADGPVSLEGLKTSDTDKASQDTSSAPGPRRSGSSMWLVAIVVIIIVALGGAVAAFFLAQ